MHKAKGSKFIGQAHRATTKNKAEALVKNLWAQHPKANHICYAYLVDETAGWVRANDDGEPNHSAGTPILNQIRGAELQETLITVVRYFGGTLLGVSGLISAYKATAKGAIEVAKVVEDYPKSQIQIVFPYTSTDAVMQRVDRSAMEIMEANYQEMCTLLLQLPKDELETHVAHFKQLGIKVQP